MVESNPINSSNAQEADVLSDSIRIAVLAQIDKWHGITPASGLDQLNPEQALLLVNACLKEVINGATRVEDMVITFPTSITDSLMIGLGVRNVAEVISMLYRKHDFGDKLDDVSKMLLGVLNTGFLMHEDSGYAYNPSDTDFVYLAIPLPVTKLELENMNWLMSNWNEVYFPQKGDLLIKATGARIED